MDIQEIIRLLQEPPEEGVPDTIYDDLTAEYNGLTEGWAAKAAAHEQTVADLLAQISALKAQNFDLLMSQGTPVENSEPDTPDDHDGETLDDLIIED